jgi:RHS repeat-associated protein
MAYDGLACAYDAMGNPTNYLGNAAVWSAAGTLASYKGASYAYDLDGVRSSKTVSGILTTFDTLGTKILRMTVGANPMVFRYLGGELVGFSYGGSEYFYAKDGQGDVSAIYDSTGALVASYVYDAWGNQKVLTGLGAVDTTQTSIGHLNPFRYRSCFYDEETGFYYLNARYYDPAAGRFLSADAVSVLDGTAMQVNGLNLYAYCGGNPVMRADPDGKDWWEWVLGFVIIGGLIVASVLTGGMAAVVIGGALLGASIGGFFGAISNGANIKDGKLTWDWESASQGFLSGVVGGAVLGAVSAAMPEFVSGLPFMSSITNPAAAKIVALLSQAVINSAISGLYVGLTETANQGQTNPYDVIVAIGFGFASGLTGGLLGSKLYETLWSIALEAFQNYVEMGKKTSMETAILSYVS